jgi:hypothetical protein
MLAEQEVMVKKLSDFKEKHKGEPLIARTRERRMIRHLVLPRRD